MRDDWVETTLGEVARTRPPAGVAAPGIPYVALEHFDSGSPALHRWGDTADATSATTPFEPGDVLFGKLRPYLRKVVVAEFSGRCTNEALAYRVSSPALSQEYLALLLRSDAALSHASVTTGTRMPRTSARSMASMRVLLPSIEEQRRIVDLMSHIDEMVEAARMALVRSETLAQALRDRLPPAPEISLGQVVRSLDSGRSTTAKSGPGPDQEMLTLAAIRPAKFRPGRRKPVGAAQLPAQAQVHEGDLLITRSNTPQTVGYACVARGVPENLFMPDLVWRIVPDEALVSPDFLEQLLASTRGRRLVREVARGTSQSMRKINKETFRALRFPIPSLDVQSQYLAPLREVSRAISTGEEELGRLNDARSTILHALVSGGHAIPPSYDGFIRDEGAA